MRDWRNVSPLIMFIVAMKWFVGAASKKKIEFQNYKIKSYNDKVNFIVDSIFDKNLKAEISA